MVEFLGLWIVLSTSMHMQIIGINAIFPGNLIKISPPILLNFPPYLYNVFLYFRGKNSLQMSKFPGNQVPEFLLFWACVTLACAHLIFTNHIVAWSWCTLLQNKVIHKVTWVLFASPQHLRRNNVRCQFVNWLCVYALQDAIFMFYSKNLNY